MSRGVDQARGLCRQQRLCYACTWLRVFSSAEGQTQQAATLQQNGSHQGNELSASRATVSSLRSSAASEAPMLHLHHHPLYPGNWARHRRRHPGPLHCISYAIAIAVRVKKVGRAVYPSVVPSAASAIPSPSLSASRKFVPSPSVSALPSTASAIPSPSLSTSR